MSEINNPFQEGDKVVCVSDNFPWIKKYGGDGSQAVDYPYKNEILTVDETLGEFLRFDKYDTDGSFNWWLYNRFAPIQSQDDESREIQELINEAIFISDT